MSPYLRLNDRIRQLIQEKGRSGVHIRVLFGKKDLQPHEETWLRSQPNVHLSFLKNLHAKCYLHETLALVTSMNLHEFSQVHNAEMGILVSKAEDPELFDDVDQEVARLLHAAEGESAVAPATPVLGACIRCTAAIPLDPSRPYCSPCFAVWHKYGNEDYVEKVCHVCRTAFASTRRKPACHECYRQQKGVLAFPGAGARATATTAKTPSMWFKVGRLLRRLNR